MSKLGRILELIELINVKQSFTVGEMAEELGVSYRTMLRYLEELSASGIPLYSEPGKHGGYRLLQKSPGVQAASTYSSPAQLVVKPSLIITGQVIRAPYTAFRFLQSMIELTLKDLEQRLKNFDHGLKQLKMIGLMKREGLNLTYIIGYESRKRSPVPPELETFEIQVQQYASYVYHGDWNRIDIEETFLYINNLLKEELALHYDSKRFMLIEPIEDTSFNILIPLK